MPTDAVLAEGKPWFPKTDQGYVSYLEFHAVASANSASLARHFGDEAEALRCEARAEAFNQALEAFRRLIRVRQ